MNGVRSLKQACVDGDRAIVFRASPLRFHASNLVRYGRAEVFGNIVIETFSPCNRTCACCPVGHVRRPVGRMPDSLFRRIIDQLAERNYAGEIALHFYNEPTLDDRLGDFIRYARSRCPKSYLYFASNGDFLTPDKFRAFVRDGLTEVHLTQYDREPKPALRTFLDALTDRDRAHVRFEKRVVEEFPNWSNRAGHLPDRKLGGPLRRRCARPDRQLVVNAEGKVAQCCCDYLAEGDFGDTATENVFDIWRNQRFRAIRAELRRGHRAALPLCRDCDWFEEVVAPVRSARRKGRVP